MLPCTTPLQHPHHALPESSILRSPYFIRISLASSRIIFFAMSASVTLPSTTPRSSTTNLPQIKHFVEKSTVASTLEKTHCKPWRLSLHQDCRRSGSNLFSGNKGRYMTWMTPIRRIHAECLSLGSDGSGESGRSGSLSNMFTSAKDAMIGGAGGSRNR